MPLTDLGTGGFCYSTLCALGWPQHVRYIEYASTTRKDVILRGRHRMNEQYGSFCLCCGSAEPVPSIAYDSMTDPVRLPRDMYFGDRGRYVCARFAAGHLYITRAE